MPSCGRTLTYFSRRSARSEHGRFLEHDPFRTLLYPYFLTAFLIWSTEPPMDQIIVAAQQLLGVASIVCFYLAGRRAFGGRIALAGALLLSLHTTQLFYELSILSETLFTFLLAASLIPMGSFVERPTVRGAILTGVWCAVLTLTRPVAQWLVVLPLALAVWMLPAWKDRVKIAIAVAATFAVIMIPWAAVNQQQYGFFGIAIGRGFGLFIRVFDMEHFEPHEQTAYPDVRDTLRLGQGAESPATFVRDEVGGRRKFSMIQKDAIMNGFAMEAIRRQPVRFALGRSDNGCSSSAPLTTRRSATVGKAHMQPAHGRLRAEPFSTGRAPTSSSVRGWWRVPPPSYPSG